MIVYISSTAADLAEYRKSVMTTLRRQGHEYLAMEDYTASEQVPLQRCLEDVARSELYIGLFAWRYGFIPPGEAASITELEYRHALRKRIPVLLFLVDPDAAWPYNHIDRGDPGDSIANLRQEFQEHSLVDFFSTADELAAKVASSVSRIREATSISSDSRPSLAILPFANLSPHPENTFFCDGLADELIDRLSKVPRIRLASRTSSFSFREFQGDLQEIGQKLSVHYIIEGSVRRADERLRVSVQLCDTRTGFQVWSTRYDHVFEDVFGIQDSISQNVLECLEHELECEDGIPAKSEHPTKDMHAYKCFLRGRYEWNRRTPHSIQAAMKEFETALSHDNEFALAQAGLADCYAVLGLYQLVPAREVMPKAIALAERALERDPTIAESYATLGLAKAVYEYDWSAAEKAFRKSIHLDPNFATAHFWFALFVLAPHGRLDEALDYATRAVQLDPATSIHSLGPGVIMNFQRRYDEAIDQFSNLCQLDPNVPMFSVFLQMSLTLTGRSKEALLEAEKNHSLTLLLLGMRGFTLAVAKHTAEAEKIIDQLLELHREGQPSEHELARVYAALGQVEDAAEWFQRSFEVRAAPLVWAMVSPQFELMQNSPRFLSLLKTMGLHCNRKSM